MRALKARREKINWTQKLLAIFLTLILCLSICTWHIPVAQAASYTINTNGTSDISKYGNGATITINSGLTVKLTNTGGAEYTNMKIACGAGVTLTIDGIKIDNSKYYNASPLSFTGSNNRLILAGQSSFQSSDNLPGIKVEAGTGLEISGEGSVTARGSGYGAGIGAGNNKGFGTITISNGTVNAYGKVGAGIGGTNGSTGGTVNISGGTVKAYGGYCSAGIGGSTDYSAGTINISGGVVTAVGNQDGPGIGGWNGDGIINISGGTVNATGGTHYGAGIGGGLGASGGTITISGGSVTAEGGMNYEHPVPGGAGIGGGYEGNGGSISIIDGTVTAIGSWGAAGIGAGAQGTGGTVTIEGGTIVAVGGKGGSHDDTPFSGGAGIGGGYQGGGGETDIEGGLIFAEGKDSAEDIGAGASGSGSAEFNISGSSTVFLRSGDCTEPTTTTHGKLTIEAVKNGRINGLSVPEGWAAPVYAYLNGNDSAEITYNTNGGTGTLPSPVTQNKGTQLAVASGGDLIKDGRIFGEWNTQSNGRGEGFVPGEEMTVTNDMILYAIYGDIVPVSSVKLNRHAVAVVVGNTLPLSPTVLPENACNPDLTWSTSNKWVATVNGNGVVTALSEGTAKITATAGGKSDSCDVVVIEEPRVFEGAGTEKVPYLITSAEDLALMASLVNDGDMQYADKYYLQTQDIDLSDYDNWTPIGTYINYAGCPFSGIYNGNDKEITGMNIDVSSSESSSGLFGYVTGTVKNISLLSGSIDINNTFGASVGGIADKLSNGTIENCNAAVDITIATKIDVPDSYVHAGGIVSKPEVSSISNCVNYGDISLQNGETIFTGGIAAAILDSTIEKCANSGSITADGNTDYTMLFMGGITGSTSGGPGDSSIISQSYNIGQIYGKCRNSVLVGGIAGSGVAEIFDCFNTGGVGYEAGGDTGSGGGIAGLCDYGDIIQKCYNNRQVNGNLFVGGITGACYSSDNVSNCYYVNSNAAGDNGGSAIAKSLEELRQQGTYTGFNFDDVWTMAGDESYDYPKLRSVPMLEGYVKSVTLNANEQEMMLGDTLALTATVLPGDANYTTTWSTSNDEVATVDQTGKVTAVGVGSATITVTADIKSTSCEIVIKGLFEGAGTELDPFQIADAEDLALLATLVNAGDSPYAEKDYVQTKNIDLSNYDNWIPIGKYKSSVNTSEAFKGNYDGGNNIIKNLKIQSSISIISYLGLFGCSTGIIRNVDLRDSSIMITGTATPYVGGIVASLNGNGRIENCRSKISISINSSAFYIYTGGVVGRASGTCFLSECVNESNITVNGDETAARVGGVAGMINDGVEVSRCANTGSLFASVNDISVQLGGIVGLASTSGTISNVKQCFNTGLIESNKKGYTGGIVGYSVSADVLNCFNYGNIESNLGSGDNVGGIVGINNCLIENCYNIGSITGTSIIGGIVGTSSGNVRNCYYANSAAAKGVGSGSDTTTVNTLEQLKLIETFAGFDFETVWTMEGTTYPYPELTTLNLIGIPALSIEVISDTSEVIETNTLQLSATVMPNYAEDKTVTWSVDNGTGTATISQNGLLTGTKVGTVIVKASACDGSGVFGTKSISVLKKAVTSVKMSTNSATLVHHNTLTLTASVTPVDATYPDVVWSSSNEDVATVSNSGIVIAVGVGNAIITATADGVSDTCIITVKKKDVSSVKLSSESHTLIMGETVTLTADVNPDDATYPKVAWSSNNAKVATVDQKGKVTTVGLGNAIITATADGVSGTCSITVRPKQFTISAVTNNTSYGSVSGAGVYTEGTTASLKAVPKAGYRFVRWVEGTTQVSTSYEYKFTVNKGRTLKAEFAPINTPAISGIAASGYNSIKLTWTAVTGATGYEVYRSMSSAGTYSKIYAATPGSSANYSNTGLNTNQAYYYKVRAYCNTGGTVTYGGFSSHKSAIPILAVPSIAPVSASYNSIKVSWRQIAGASGYEIYCATSKSGTYKKTGTVSSGSTVSYTNKSLTTGKTYYYKVRAFRIVNSKKEYSVYSSIKSAVPVPAVPKSVKAARVSSSSIKISWGSVSGKSGYEVWRASSRSGTYKLIKSTTSASYTNTRLTKGKTYYYKVRAYTTVSGKKVYGSFSSIVSAKP